MDLSDARMFQLAIDPEDFAQMHFSFLSRNARFLNGMGFVISKVMHHESLALHPAVQMRA